MSEPMFFQAAKRTSLADIVSCTGALVVENADLRPCIIGVALLGEAGPGELTFSDTPDNASLLEACRATACFVTPADAPHLPEATFALVLEDPYRGFALALRRIFPEAALAKSLLGTAGISPGASIHPEARLEQGVVVDPGAVIGPRVEIGLGSIIGANSVIGSDVRIGRDCLIGPQVTISHALIGDRVVVHAGVRIGQSAIDLPHPAGERLPRVPRIGRVVIQDGVEVGANSTIDRGAAGDTVIGEETRIGNLTCIAENVALGRFSVVPARTGVSPNVQHAGFTVLGT